MITATDILTSEQDRVSFMTGIIALAKIGGVEPSEFIFFEKAMESLSLSEESTRQLIHLLTSGEQIRLNLTFSGQRQALFLLKEGVQLCHMDGRYSAAEKNLIAQIADDLGIRADRVKAIEIWVAEGVAWSNRGDAILALEA